MTAAADKSWRLRIVAGFENATGEQLLGVFKWITIGLLVCLSVATRRFFNPDYISYLDIGDAWLRGDFAHAANGYWNPIFPICVAAAAKFCPNREWEPVAGHAVNLLFHLGAVGAFHWLLRQIDEFIHGTGIVFCAQASHL